MRRLATLLLAAALLMAPALVGPPSFPGWPGIGAARAVTFDTTAITLVTVRGRFDLRVELALTAEQRRQGLQFRPSLAADAGMLFDFGETAPVSMWMLNTPIPLDMVFFDAAGRIVRVVENTTPFSTAIISSEEPVRGVLEVAAGTADRLAIRKGSRILHPMFGDG